MDDDDTTSLFLENVNAKQQEDQDVLSAEDFAWADSCLIEDPEISEANMNSLKEALLDILDLHTEMLGNPSINKQDTSNGITDPQNFSSVMEEGTSYTAETSIDKNLPFLMEDGISYTGETSINEHFPFIMEEGSSYTAETSIGEHFPFVMEEGTSYTGETSTRKHAPLVLDEGTSYTAETSVDEHLEQQSYDVMSVLKQQPFLPNYNDEMMKIQYSEADDLGFVLSEVVTEPLSDDIFKVWDLDTQQKNELDKVTNDALSFDQLLLKNTRLPEN
ncbi:hypothetical protein Tco_0936295 [Tanacetum coccineum]